MLDTDICSLIFVQETSSHHIPRALVLSAMTNTEPFPDKAELLTQVIEYLKGASAWAESMACDETACGEKYGYVATLN
jgi:hypothetical protein